MTRGLKALHDKKILHRDLKSANIFLESDGSAKIGDLNVSKVAKKGLGYTQTGTPYYASPEVWKDSPYDYKSDIWSLGCVTYEMCMLHPPFRAKNMEELYNKVIKGEYGKISDKYSNDLNDVIKMLLKVNSSDRPSCGQILKSSIVKKRLEFFQAQCGFEGDEIMDEGELLKTIRIPKNILFLSEKLPGANYTLDEKKKNTFPSNNLPSIKGKIGSHRDGIFGKKMTITGSEVNNKNKEDKGKLIDEGKKRTKSREGDERKNTNVIIFERNHNRNSKSPGNSYNYIYNFSINNNNNNNINIHSNNIQKKIQQQKKNKQHKYNIEGLGLSDIYKIYAPTLDINYGHKVNKRSYEHYIYHNNKKPSTNYSNNDYISPKVIPNRRLNPINTRQIIRNFKL
jgi:NIMA (never in mitosis gene a)-related kinase